MGGNNWMKLQHRKDLPAWKTKGELATELYPTMTYDTALPQNWVNMCMEKGFDPRFSVVWGYPADTIMGRPFPLTLEADEFLSELGYNQK